MAQISEALKDLASRATLPVGVPTETITVKLNPADFVGDYAKAIVSRCMNHNEQEFERHPISVDQVTSYCEFLFTKRVDQVNDRLQGKEWRQMKNLYVPVFIEYAMTTVGIVRLRDEGLEIVPECDASSMTMEEAEQISQTLYWFCDQISLVQNGFSTSVEGNADVMSCAVIKDYVLGRKKVTEVTASYLAAFMGFKLAEETTFSALYRVQYDDLAYIKSALNSKWLSLV